MALLLHYLYRTFVFLTKVPERWVSHQPAHWFRNIWKEEVGGSTLVLCGQPKRFERKCASLRPRAIQGGRWLLGSAAPSRRDEFYQRRTFLGACNGWLLFGPLRCFLIPLPVKHKDFLSQGRELEDWEIPGGNSRDCLPCSWRWLYCVAGTLAGDGWWPLVKGKENKGSQWGVSGEKRADEGQGVPHRKAESHILVWRG